MNAEEWGFGSFYDPCTGALIPKAIVFGTGDYGGRIMGQGDEA